MKRKLWCVACLAWLLASAAGCADDSATKTEPTPKVPDPSGYTVPKPAGAKGG